MLARMRRLLGKLADRLADTINVEPRWANMWDDDVPTIIDEDQDGL